MPRRLGIRAKLVLLSLVILVGVSSAFTALSFTLSRGWIDEDLQDRAIAFAREVAATIGDRRELENGPLLERQIEQIMSARQSVVQL
ncbi:MAG TPA: hypothetical protein VFX28_00625, partial [Methylomirabilota bacterium]|nr:hypothetical protein [Methylomirabilota bacterium]